MMRIWDDDWGDEWRASHVEIRTVWQGYWLSRSWDLRVLRLSNCTKKSATSFLYFREDSQQSQSHRQLNWNVSPWMMRLAAENPLIAPNTWCTRKSLAFKRRAARKAARSTHRTVVRCGLPPNNVPIYCAMLQPWRSSTGRSTIV